MMKGMLFKSGWNLFETYYNFFFKIKLSDFSFGDDFF